MSKIDGQAIVYCQGAFNTPNGKTAHGLVRHTERYNILAVVDDNYAGRDAGQVLDGQANDIPIVATLNEAVKKAKEAKIKATHFVIGIAPDGGKINERLRSDVIKAIKAGLNIDSGLHDCLSDDNEINALANEKGIRIRDVRKPLAPDKLHFFSGKIAEVKSMIIAVLGTDSAVGKRTTAWLIVQEMRRRGYIAELIGTGQTAWLQGARHSIVIDSLINDFVSGEIEHAVWSAWQESRPDIIVLEGQGSMLNPAYPGGYELIAAGRPNAVVLQHAPARKDYDGFPGHPIHPLKKQIRVIEEISDKPVIAVTVNHEKLDKKNISSECIKISSAVSLPVSDPLLDKGAALVDVIEPMVKKNEKTLAIASER